MSASSPARLSDLEPRYDVLLCDVWGVIHNGRESFPDACAALTRFRETGKPVVLISNAPRPAYDVHPQLDGLKVPRSAWSTLVTSGDATRRLLKDRAPGPVYAIGPERDFPLYEGLGLEFAGPDEAAFLSVTGPVDDTVETPEDYRAVFERLAPRKLELICANPDRVVQRGTQLIYCGGALADVYEALGGPVLMAGKPYKPIYDLALEEAERLLGRPVDRARVLCVGDGLPTDVKGANAQGLDVLFTAGGIHRAEVIDAEGRFDAGKTARVLADAGLTATWSALDLEW